MIGGRSALLAAGAGLGYGNWTGNYSDVSLLLRNGTPLLIPLDESPTPKAITQFGNAFNTTTVVKHGTSAMAFDGSGDYFTAPDSDDFYFPGDFTIECWVYLNVAGSSTRYIYAQWVDGGGSNRNVSLSSDGVFYMNRSGTNYTVSIGGISVGSWTHTAITLQGTTLRGFKNGELVANSTVAGAANNSTAPFGIGAYGNGTYPFNGYIDDLRITKGVARYTSDFSSSLPAELPANATGDPHYSDVSLLLRNGTPSELLIPLDESPTPKEITPTDNAGINTTVFKYGTSSLMLDGNGDWFETNATTDFDFANNPFTIEAWINVSVLTSLAGVITVMNNLSFTGLHGYGLIVDSNGSLVFQDYVNGSAAFSLSSAAGVITTGQWYHVAICKEGTSTNQVRLFVNGQIVASGTRNANIPVATTGQPARIGAWRYPTALRYFNGYIDDLRITKGFARYTKNFLPPPAELPAI